MNFGEIQGKAWPDYCPIITGTISHNDGTIDQMCAFVLNPSVDNNGGTAKVLVSVGNIYKIYNCDDNVLEKLQEISDCEWEEILWMNDGQRQAIDPNDTFGLKHRMFMPSGDPTLIEAPADAICAFLHSISGEDDYVQQIVSRDSEFILSIVPKQDVPGKSFAGWSRDADKNGIGKLESKVTSLEGETTLDLYAIWQGPPKPSTPRYTIKFETDGGSKVNSQRVKRGNTASMPEEPTKAGFDFDGWYVDEDFSEEYDFNTKVRNSITLYAKWNSKDMSAHQIVLTIDSLEAKVFGKTVTNDVAPIIVNDRTMLPIRFVAENLGANVEWIAEERKIVITRDDLYMVITIDDEIANVNGDEVELDSPAFIRNDRTYLPVRFVAENLGARVLWTAEARQVIITK